MCFVEITVGGIVIEQGVQAAITSAVIGAAVSAGTQSAAANAQERIAENAAETADNKAKAASDEASATASDRRAKASFMLASQRAALSAGGADVGSGSALGILTNTAEFAATDIQRIQQQGENTSWGYRQQAEDALAASALNKQRVGYNIGSTLIGAGTSSLTSVFGSSASRLGGRAGGLYSAGAPYRTSLAKAPSRSGRSGFGFP